MLCASRTASQPAINVHHQLLSLECCCIIRSRPVACPGLVFTPVHPPVPPTQRLSSVRAVVDKARGTGAWRLRLSSRKRQNRKCKPSERGVSAISQQSLPPIQCSRYQSRLYDQGHERLIPMRTGSEVAGSCSSIDHPVYHPSQTPQCLIRRRVTP